MRVRCSLACSLLVACVEFVAGFLPQLPPRNYCHRLQLIDEAVFPDEEVMQMVPGIVVKNAEAWRIDEEDGSLYCWRWRQSERVWQANTAVAKSKLPMLASDDDDDDDGVCYGLFAMRDFAAGETIGYYDGTIIGTCEQLDYSDWLPLYLKDHDKVVQLELPYEGEEGVACYVDGATGLTGLLQYANDAIGTDLECNMDWDATGRFFATRPIAAGEELLFGYGAGYWEKKQQSTLLSE
jgi:SET domain